MEPAPLPPARSLPEEVGDERILFPHEQPNDLPFREPGERLLAQPGLGQAVGLALAGLAYLRALNVGGSMGRVCARFYRLCNGVAGGAQLSNKAAFGQLVLALGYSSPQTEVVAPGVRPAEIRARLEARFPADQPLFCKPADGFQGRGAFRAADAAAAAERLACRRVPYLVQNFERSQEDWRYVLHQDRRRIEGDSRGRIWRIAYKKIRPSVVGDGASSVHDLVQASAEIPPASKKTLLRKVRRAILARVPAARERVDLVLTGNITQGAYGRLPDRQELAVMDAFMVRFHRDLEEALGARIATACLDLGVKDAAALRGGSSPDRVRDQITFFEFQFPFGLKGYRAWMPVPAAVAAPWSWLPRGWWRAAWRWRTVLRFFGSIANSGRARPSKAQGPGGYTGLVFPSTEADGRTIAP